jgi:hypothetical protein
MDMGRHGHGSNYLVWSYLTTGNPYHRRCCFDTLFTNPIQERLAMAKLKNIIFRILALFGSSALAAVAGGALIGVQLWKSAALAGIMACAQVVEKLLRFSVDGSLSKEEIELAFTGAVKAKPEVAE